MSKPKNAAHAAHDDHRPDVKKYMLVFGALMVLTGVTVLISKFHLPRPQAIALGLFVALVKASLVGAIFMHLWGEKKLIIKFLAVTVFAGALMVIPMIDLHAVAHKLTQRMPVAEQHPSEEGTVETVTAQVELPAPPKPEKPAAKPAHKKK